MGFSFFNVNVEYKYHFLTRLDWANKSVVRKTRTMLDLELNGVFDF